MPAIGQTAKEAQPVSTEEIETEKTKEAQEATDEIERDILDSLDSLTNRKTAQDTVAKLISYKDIRVKRLFERIVDNQVYARGNDVVWAPVLIEDEQGDLQATLFPLLSPLKDDGSPDAEAVETVPYSELSRFRVFRRAFNEMRDSLAIIGLELEDPVERERSAIDVGNKRQLEAVPLLTVMVDEDPDPAIRRAAKESLALINASGSNPDADDATIDQAIVTLGEFKSIRALDLLKSLRDAPTPETSSTRSNAIDTSIGQIEGHITFTNKVKDAFFGLSLGSILVLMAVGLAITFGLMGVINMAHGEMLMIGAIATWATFVYLFRGDQLFAWLPGWPEGLLLSAEWAYVVAFPIAFIVAALVGLLVEVTIVRFLYKRPLDSLLATIGVSFILIQLVRNWKGDNLALTRPEWASGSFELMQDVTLSYARLFLILLSIFCVIAVVVLFRFTKIGLMLRATSQNREMAQTLGVNTRRVDMFTFAFGSGLAGLAGFGLYLINSVSPQMGQGYIVDSFLVVVVGGVGKLAGVVISGFSIGFIQKFLEPIEWITEPIRMFDATWAKVAVLTLVVLFIQRKPGGLFPEKGRAANQADSSDMPWLGRPTWLTDGILGGLVILIGLGLVPTLYLTGYLSIDDVNKYGYFVTYAICAVGLDLLWGYVGVLSLCQFLFFALGAYAMGFYLINHGPKIEGIPECLYYVMSGTGDLQAPWYLSLFESLPVAFLLALLLPGVAALIIGVMMFRSRVRGVYFAILTQTLTVIALQVFQKNDLKMGGTNGIRITFTEELFGNPIATQASLALHEQTRFRLYILSVIALLFVIVVAKLITRSRYGRVLLAIRDDETRLRFSGYKTWVFKTAVFVVAGMMAGLGGALYLPQKGIITPGDMAPYWSILVVAWVAIGGRGTIWGAVLGAIGVSMLYSWMTTNYPEYWMFALGGLFVLVPLLLPGGIMSLPIVLMNLVKNRNAVTDGDATDPPPMLTQGGKA